jgi:arsenite/tail-anchored protein-transporting ATPase
MRFLAIGVGETSIWDRELVMVTGKGGVGKTTVAAALARKAHRAGRSVVIADVSSDATTRSQLLDLFGHGHLKSDDPVEMKPGLFGVRIMPSTGHKLFLRAALKVRIVVDAAMKSAALNRFLMAAPTFPEIGTLYHLVHILRMRRFQHVILDLPATGHALGLASLPKTVLKILPSGLIGDAIREGLQVMTDPRRGRAVIVTLPEHMPVTEALELSEGLRKLAIPVDSMILNRMPENPFSEDERKALDQHIKSRAGTLLLGTREFRKLERAISAQNLFRSTVPKELQREISLLNDGEPARIVQHVEQAL